MKILLLLLVFVVVSMAYSRRHITPLSSVAANRVLAKSAAVPHTPIQNSRVIDKKAVPVDMEKFRESLVAARKALRSQHVAKMAVKH